MEELGDRACKLFGPANIDDLAGGLEPLPDSAICGDFARLLEVRILSAQPRSPVSCWSFSSLDASESPHPLWKSPMRATTMPSVPDKALVTQERDVTTYAELWHASECVLAAGVAQPVGSSWQFLSSIILTAFAFEAYVNHVGPKVLSCWESLERLSPNAKLQLLCVTLKVNLPGTKGERPLQTVSELFKFRNTLAHGRSETITPEPKNIDIDELDTYRTQRLLSDWEQLIENCDFAKRAREDVEVVLKLVQAARPGPKESLFVLGGRTWSATV
jgi:hypothetical protein